MFALAAIAAHEGRSTLVMDIDGDFLNAVITDTGIKVHMRLNRSLMSMLTPIDPRHARFVEEQGTSVVELDKALHGCVDAAALWYANLSATLTRNHFTPNNYDPCVFNKVQIGMKFRSLSRCMLTTYLILAQVTTTSRRLRTTCSESIVRSKLIRGRCWTILA